MPSSRRFPTVLIHFGDEDQDLLRKLEAYCEASAAPRSAAVKRCLRAVLDGDADAARMIRSFQKPRALTAARRERASA